MTGKSNQSPIVFVSIYIIILLGFFAASFLTDIRLWGLSTWGYLPIWVRFVFVLIGLAAIPVALKIGKATSADKSPGNFRTILTIGVAAIAAGICFWLFRGQTHFLGDGYGNIGLLSSRVPIVVYRDFGEMQAHLWLAKLLGGNNKENVLLSYEILSVAAGVLFVGLISWTAHRVYEQLRDTLLFALAVLLSGQSLLFFGYVENYSLFILSVGGFVCVGLLAASGKISRWAILIPLTVAIILHILGTVLIPSAIYLLMAGGKMERRITNSSSLSKISVGLVIFGLAVAALWLAMQQSLFLRVALLSLNPTRFTVEGYTLLSSAHLADFANLLVLLIPGILLLLTGAMQLPWRILLARTDYRFLLLLTACVTTAAFIFDPKLGMPRDWDLFSFVAVPLAMLLAYPLLEGRNCPAYGRTVVALAVVLAALSGAARVATQFVPAMALRQVEDYVELDEIKGKNAMVLLQSYYSGLRDQATFAYWGNRFRSFPEERLMVEADSLIAKKQLREAFNKLERAVHVNPMTSGPYTYLSVIYTGWGQIDRAKAALDTALALNPSNPQAHVGKGYFLQMEGRLKDAERFYIRATELAPEKCLSFYYLAQLRLSLADTAQYLQYLDSAVTKHDAAPELHMELCNAYISRGRIQEAAEHLRIGIGRGLNRQAVEAVVKNHPELQEYLIR